MATQKTKKKKPITRLIQACIAGVALVCAVFLFSSSIQEIIANYRLNQELNSVKLELESVVAEQESLSLEKTKLQDPNYVQNYARGAHLLSSEDEQVFILVPEE